MVIPRKKLTGFTLIELLVVMAIIAILLSLVVPRYFGNVDKAKEAVLKDNLSTIRNTLDKYYSDKGKYPETLGDLVSENYLRNIPIDPITETSDTWIVIPPKKHATQGKVFDIHSGATGHARDGTNYGDW